MSLIATIFHSFLCPRPAACLVQDSGTPVPMGAESQLLQIANVPWQQALKLPLLRHLSRRNQRLASPFCVTMKDRETLECKVTFLFSGQQLWWKMKLVLKTPESGVRVLSASLWYSWKESWMFQIVSGLHFNKIWRAEPKWTTKTK